MGKSRTAYKNEYISGKYDRINFVLPQGKKAEIKERADSLGFSVNEYLLKLVQNDIDGKSGQDLALSKLSEDHIAMLKRAQVAQAYYEMIDSVNFSRGRYVVELKNGYTNDHFGGRVLNCRNMKELRATINKSHKIGAKPPTKCNNPQKEWIIPERFSEEEIDYLKKWQIPLSRYEQIERIEFLSSGTRIFHLMPGFEYEGADYMEFSNLRELRAKYPRIQAKGK